MALRFPNIQASLCIHLGKDGVKGGVTRNYKQRAGEQKKWRAVQAERQRGSNKTVELQKKQNKVFLAYAKDEES